MQMMQSLKNKGIFDVHPDDLRRKRVNRSGTVWKIDTRLTQPGSRAVRCLVAAVSLLLASPAIAQEPSEEVKINALKLGYLLNGSSMTRHPHNGSIDVSSMTLDSPHIREIPLDKPIFPKADDPEAAAVEGPPPAASTHRKKRHPDR